MMKSVQVIFIVQWPLFLGILDIIKPIYLGEEEAHFNIDERHKRNENVKELLITMANISFQHPLYAGYFTYSIVKHHSNYEKLEL